LAVCAWGTLLSSRASSLLFPSHLVIVWPIKLQLVFKNLVITGKPFIYCNHVIFSPFANHRYIS
jgi:hypothetical protein